MYKQIKPTIFYPVKIYVMCYEEAKKRKFDTTGYKAFTYADKGVVKIAINLDDYDTSLIVHECIHASMYILDFCGVEISINNDETLCYLNEHIFNEVMKEIEKHKNKDIKK